MQRVTIPIDIRMKHATDKLDLRGLRWIRLVKGHQEFKSPVLKRRLLGCCVTLSECHLQRRCTGRRLRPKMTQFQTMTLSGHGAPETPSGASLWSLLKSRIKRRLAGVDMALGFCSKIQESR